MSAARPISNPVILLALTAVAALGFWRGFQGSYFSSEGIKSCTPNGATVPGAVPLAQPITNLPAPIEAPKPAEAPKKKADTPKTEDPGTAQHDLTPLPKADVPKETAPPAPVEPAKPAKPEQPKAPGPDEPPY